MPDKFNKVRGFYRQANLPRRYWYVEKVDAEKIIGDRLKKILVKKSVLFTEHGLNAAVVAAYLVKCAIEKKATVLWVNYFDLRGSDKKTFNDESSLTARMKAVDLLIMDGFHEGMMIPFEFKELLKFRWDWEKNSIVIYNGTSKWFMQQMDKGTINILKAGYDLIEIGGG